MITVGVMTGNSLDAVDTVLTRFDGGRMADLAACSLPYPAELRNGFLTLRERIARHGYDVSFLKNDAAFTAVLKSCTDLVAETVNTLCRGFDKPEIAAIGLHGQTCGHFPPSVAGDAAPYTLQVFDPARLAALTGLPVIYDFRSDDMANGGEGAPLAPIHNAHIAADLKEKGLFPVAFCNAGNTGNIAVVSETADGKSVTAGWDVGPFNHFADALSRFGTGEPCDLDGRFGRRGRIVPELLAELFDTAAVTGNGDNFYLLPPPKSSDPSWYRINAADVCARFGFENALRTVEYLGAYGFMTALSMIGENVKMPQSFLLFGGGWKNPLVLNDFKGLLNGAGVVLPRHADVFARVRSRFSRPPAVDFSDRYGYSGTYMEARIFADMARCRITGEPFSFPETTGCQSPTVAGIYALPPAGAPLLDALFEQYGTKGLIPNPPPRLFSRAAKESRI